MKRLLAIAVIALSAGFIYDEAAAQTVMRNNSTTVSRSGKVLRADGKKMTTDETFDYVAANCGLPYAQRWNNSAKLYGVGKGLLISSAVTIPVGVASGVIGTALVAGGAVGGSIGAAVSGSITGEAELTPETQRTIRAGAALAICGTALAAVGLSTLIAGSVCVPIGKSRMNDIVGRCNAANNDSNVTMNFGSCPHGVGMTLNF